MCNMIKLFVYCAVIISCGSSAFSANRNLEDSELGTLQININDHQDTLLSSFQSWELSTAKRIPDISIDLHEKQPGETITQFHNLSATDYRIHLLNINDNVSFLLVQVHTFLENVTLSYKYPKDTNLYVTGTNIGLVWERDLGRKYGATNKTMASFYLFRYNELYENLNLLISVTTYSKNDPVPGGCNLSFETMIAPYQHINQTDEVIIVKNQPPSTFGIFCNKTDIITDMYYLYLNEYDNSTDEYFDSIQKMLTVDNILKYGTKVPRGPNPYIQMYSRYSGIGRIFAVVSSHQGSSSAYVPIASFGCNLSSWDEDCIGPDGVHWKLIIAILFICGLLICFGGHIFFRMSLFITSYIVGVLTMLIIFEIYQDFSTEGKVIFSLIIAVFLAISWLFLWWYLGSPVISVQFTFLLAGFIVASIIFYSPLANIYLFDDYLFWTCFILIMLAVSQGPMFFLSSLHNIIALSFLGSYGMIVALNYYVGGNLPYIVINTYRRITTVKFRSAIIDPPYQFLDLIQTILWVVLFAVGIYVQYKYSLGKFPTSRAGRDRGRNQRPSESTPLLYPELDLPPAYTPEVERGNFYDYIIFLFRS